MSVFSLPLELFLEVFSYLADHRRFIRENYYGRKTFAYLGREHAERSITIRRLTMTCWTLRNRLLPLLWVDVEACISHIPYDHFTRSGGVGSHLYAQCAYLSSNPAIAAYVRTFSVRLPPMRYPQDLIDKFVECIVRLPNLKTLEVLEVRARAPISKALRRKHAIFPTIRELRITPACHHFIRKCPNLKDLTFTTTMDTYAPSTLLAYGKGLRRVAGVTGGVHGISWGCPDLREIGIVGSSLPDREEFKTLRRLKHLAVINVDLAYECGPHGDWVRPMRANLKKEFISILKDSPSTDRKFLRWKVVRSTDPFHRTHEVVEDQEVEVF